MKTLLSKLITGIVSMKNYARRENCDSLVNLDPANYNKKKKTRFLSNSGRKSEPGHSRVTAKCSKHYTLPDAVLF